MKDEERLKGTLHKEQDENSFGDCGNEGGFNNNGNTMAITMV